MAKPKQKTDRGNAKTEANAVATVPTRGHTFEGFVVKKFPTRVVIEAERTVYVKKFERFYKKMMRIHARLPAGMDVQIGDYVVAQETRPLSKIIHAMVIKKLRSAAQAQENKK